MSGAWLGVLTHVVPPGLVEEAVSDGLAWEMRLRSLPARVTAYFVLGLCLFTQMAYADVFLEVTAGLKLAAPATTALTRARRRLGDKPLESVFRQLCGAVSPGTEPWSHIGGLLAVAWDGTGITLADSEACAAAFGRPGGGAKKGSTPPAPQARLVALIACGTRGVLDAAFGPCRGKGTAERALASRLLGSLRAGMLLLADKGFYSYGLWTAAAATGAGLLWRAKDSMHLPAARPLPDGSWLTHVNDPRAVKRRIAKNGKRRRRGSPLPPDTSPLPGLTIRVIEYLVIREDEDGTRRTERFRLLTTLLDHRAHPAAMLAAGYTRRWSVETGWREVKTSLRGTGRALRSRDPDLARQELWALLAVYQAIRILIARAAAGRRLDPGRISFTAALQAIRRTASAGRGELPAALDTAEAEMLAALLPPRDDRICPRTLKRIPFASFPARKHGQGPISRHAVTTVTISPPGTRTPARPDQPKQPATTGTQPP